MTIVALSGMHGVGKTTAVNKFTLNAPLIKITDSDMIPVSGTGFKQQLMRASLAFTHMQSISPHMNMIIDRSPYDFMIYNRIVLNNFPIERAICNTISERLIASFNALGPVVTILVWDDYDKILSRISKRGRKDMREEDEDFNRRIYDMFYEQEGNRYIAITGQIPIYCHVDDLLSKLSELF